MDAIKKLEKLRKENNNIVFTIDTYGHLGLFIYAEYKGLKFPIGIYKDNFKDYTKSYKKACESFLRKDENYLKIKQELDNGFNKAYQRFSYNGFLQMIIAHSQIELTDGIIKVPKEE